MLQSAGGALFDQAILHGKLAQIEWALEKARLLRLLGTALLGYAFLSCALIFSGALVLACCWDTAYRIPAATALALLFALATAVSWRRFQALCALSDESFAGTRVELAADLALLRSRL
ncbi:MAG: hypothetical protein ABSF96_15210 [Steroidobacteraceae bacterium]|jgi:uncharacterized membrane protein YqjE